MSASRMLSGKLLEPTTTVPALAASPFSGSLPSVSLEEPQPVSAAAATTSRETAEVAEVRVLLAMVTCSSRLGNRWGVGGWWARVTVPTIQSSRLKYRQDTNRSLMGTVQ